MKIKVIAAISVILAIIVASCQSEEQMEYQRYYNGGKILYEKHCQNCHNANGQGLSSLIPPLTDSVYLRANRAKLACMVKYGINETIIKINGKAYEGAMPATDLAPIEIAKVLTYVNNSFGNKMGLTDVDQVGEDLADCK